MTSTSPGHPECGSATGAAVPPGDSDVSCRVPLFVLFVGAAAWLVAASVFGLLASIKFHSPDFLSHCAWLTYGRAHAAAVNSQWYGFALPAGLGVALWIFARVGGNRAFQPWLIAIGGKIWNLGVLAGVIGILAGDSTGFENFEMPRYAAVLLFLGYLIIGLWTALTLHYRRSRRLSPSQWFLLTALFWFPWIYSTAMVLLLISPVRGVEQSVIGWWYSNNLGLVWLGLAGLAVLFHFVPKLTGRPLYSEYVALFIYWTLILFGSWAGLPGSAPLPVWLPTLSTVATVLTLVPLLAVIFNMHRTLEGQCRRLAASPSLLFMGFGLGAWVVAGLMRIAGVLPGFNSTLNFTWFTVAQSYLHSYGFFAMVMFGAIYHVIPAVTGLEWPLAKAVRAHFWLAAAGILLFVVPLAIGGVYQGMGLNHPHTAFADLARGVLPFLRVSTLGEIFVLIGHLLLAANVAALSLRYYRLHFLPVYSSAVAEWKPAEERP